MGSYGTTSPPGNARTRSPAPGSRKWEPMNEITQFLTSHGGLILFVVVFVEQLGVPLPSAPWLLVAGSLAAGGMLNPFLSILMAALACVLADSLWFYLGRRGGRRVLA